MEKHHVMVIEDDLSIRNALSNLLKMEGYDVTLAENGKIALEQIHAGKVPCLILLDWMMPVMNGKEFCDRLSQIEKKEEIPIILITGDGHSQEKKKTIGAVEVLEKPVNVDDLLILTQKYCKLL